MTLCILCNRKAKISCKKCGAKFCDESHEKLHKNTLNDSNNNDDKCYPFQIRETFEVGRYVVASRKIRAGEVIFHDVPLAVGPNHESSPICLGCMAQVDLSFFCTDCHYPLCGNDCLHSKDHLQLCQIFSKENKKCGVTEGSNSYAYHAILPLKLLLLKRFQPERFALMDRLMDHNQQRSMDPYWQECQEKVIDRLRQNCEQTDLEELEIHRMIGILETNAYEITSNGAYGFRGLFPLSSLLSHGCRTNVFHQWTTKPPFTDTVIASVDIQKGEEIFSAYVYPATCTLTRRKKLQECWYFECTCPRCADPTEGGSFAGAIVCQNCKNRSKGQINYMLLKDPLNFDSDYFCESCGAAKESSEVTKLVEDYKKKIINICKNIQMNFSEFHSLLPSALETFHPCHEIISEMSAWMVPFLCRAPCKSPTDFPLSELKLKRSLCLNLLKVYDVGSPGINRRRGKAMFELAECEVGILSKSSDEQDDSMDLPDILEVQTKLKEVISLCQESIRCLSNIGETTVSEELMLRSAQRLQGNAEAFLKNF